MTIKSEISKLLLNMLFLGPFMFFENNSKTKLSKRQINLFYTKYLKKTVCENVNPPQHYITYRQ